MVGVTERCGVCGSGTADGVRGRAPCGISPSLSITNCSEEKFWEDVFRDFRRVSMSRFFRQINPKVKLKCHVPGTSDGIFSKCTTGIESMSSTIFCGRSSMI